MFRRFLQKAALGLSISGDMDMTFFRKLIKDTEGATAIDTA